MNKVLKKILGISLVVFSVPLVVLGLKGCDKKRTKPTDDNVEPSVELNVYEKSFYLYPYLNDVEVEVTANEYGCLCADVFTLNLKEQYSSIRRLYNETYLNQMTIKFFESKITGEIIDYERVVPEETEKINLFFEPLIETKYENISEHVGQAHLYNTYSYEEYYLDETEFELLDYSQYSDGYVDGNLITQNLMLNNKALCEGGFGFQVFIDDLEPNEKIKIHFSMGYRFEYKIKYSSDQEVDENELMQSMQTMLNNRYQYSLETKVDGEFV